MNKHTHIHTGCPKKTEKVPLNSKILETLKYFFSLSCSHTWPLKAHQFLSMSHYSFMGKSWQEGNICGICHMAYGILQFFKLFPALTKHAQSVSILPVCSTWGHQSMIKVTSILVTIVFCLHESFCGIWHIAYSKYWGFVFRLAQYWPEWNLTDKKVHKYISN